MNNLTNIRLTQYSHGAGCGCKISPKILDQILANNLSVPGSNHLLVGNHSRDDAAALDIGNGMALISTTDFFMPIVDDPYTFGRIAAANAISDIYAMGGKPVLAIGILGWPIDKLPAEVARKVIEGGRSICLEAGISLAGGHSIDSPEPIFGLAVNGLVAITNLKQNNTARENDLFYLTKPLGVGILTTAEKKGLLKPEHKDIAARQMMQLNKVGEALGALESVSALTDVTGFGLLGHLVEMAEGSNLSAEVDAGKIPLITDDVSYYLEQKSIPGGTNRNWDSYGNKIDGTDNRTQAILADPQTSGGLLIAVNPAHKSTVETVLRNHGLDKHTLPIGRFVSKREFVVLVQ